MLLPVVELKTRRTSPHPWIFRKMVRLPRYPLEAGALVRVRDRDGRDHGPAFFHPENTIALRLLDADPDENVDAAFFARRLFRAREKRVEEWGLDRPDNDGYRVVNAEADGLPALVVDRFGSTILVEPFAAGWLHIMDWVVDGLRAIFPGATVAVRADPRTEAKEGVSFDACARRWPAPEGGETIENGLRFGVDFRHGHKTGFFLDQRANRLRLRLRARGRDVLDCCCYSGGFSLNAAMRGARSVVGVDLDEKAVDTARDNLARNASVLPDGGAAVRFEHADAFDFLRERAASKTRCGVVVLDPPKFAAGPAEVAAALSRYADLNRLAMRALDDDGLLVTCSCSGAVSPQRWLKTIRDAARSAGVRLTEESMEGADVDHPCLSTFPEGRYLKVLFARVHRTRP